jgi:uncharacterized protein
MRRILKVAALSLFALILGAALALIAGRYTSKLPDERITPGGLRQSSSVYVPMRDGTQIAVSVMLPADWHSGEKLPTLMRTARYWREPQVGWTARALIGLHLLEPGDILDRQVLYFVDRRFIVVLADARGTGASSGHRDMEFSPDEVTDIGEVAAWAAKQPWSNGRVGAFGISYEGNTAELAAVPNQPAIRAVMPMFDSFDEYDDLLAGGVPAFSLLSEWNDLIFALDHNDVCGADEAKGWRCVRDRLLTPGVRPVAGDRDKTHLAEVIRQHNNMNVIEAIKKVEFRDDTISTPAGNFTLSAISPSGLRDKINSSHTPMMIWCGWFDGEACTDVLVGYNTLTVPQNIVIGPLSHGGDHNIDPFAANHNPPVPSSEEQFEMQAAFFDQTLRKDAPAPITSYVRYYTMGQGQWHTTPTWPPAGLTTQHFYLGADHSLSAASTAPAAQNNSTDTYTVDFSTTTGSSSRWYTGVGGGDVIYPDRATEDKKLLVYDSAPLEADLEITGTPVLTLKLASTASDGAVHAYLEDVAADGRVTYMDEGLLRLLDRKEVDPRTLAYVPAGPPHSYFRADAERMTPGQPATIHLMLFTTSILLRKGHRIRLALAGADGPYFEHIPKNAATPPTWTIYRNTSFLELPVNHHP